jgi:hypothetical protein
MLVFRHRFTDDSARLDVDLAMVDTAGLDDGDPRFTTPCGPLLELRAGWRWPANGCPIPKYSKPPSPHATLWV